MSEQIQNKEANKKVVTLSEGSQPHHQLQTQGARQKTQQKHLSSWAKQRISARRVAKNRYSYARS